MNTTTALTAALVAAASAAAVPTVEYTAGHTDLAVLPTPDGIALGFSFDSNAVLLNDQPGDETTSPEVTFVRVPDSQMFPAPGAPEWAFIGSQSGNVYVLPQSSVAGVPFFGIAAEDLLVTNFATPVTLSFNAIQGPDNATFSLWQTNTSGQPVPILTSVDGLPDQVPVVIGGHSHYNWGFTEPGVYIISITATVTPTGGGDDLVDTADFYFAVGSDTTIEPPACTGDVNNDTSIDVNDLLVILNNFGIADGATPAQGDVNDDSAVDVNDLLVVLSLFGESCD